MASCTCPTGRLQPLGAEAERVFPWAGVLVLGVEYESYAEAVAEGGVAQVNDLIAWNHGAVHFVQALGSQILQNHGLRLLNAGRAVLEAVASGAGDDAAERFEREIRFLTEPSANGLTRSELLESAAMVEAPRLIPNVGFSFTAPPGAAFALLAEHVGADDAHELCALFTFLSFLTADPCETFEGLAEAASGDTGPWKTIRAADVMEQLGWGDTFDSYWDLVSAGEPVGTPYVVDPLREAMRRIGRSRLLEILARPAAHLPELEEHELRAVLPPVIVYPSRAGRLVHHLNGVARTVEGFAADALSDVAVFGAARRLVLSPEETYCDHTGCPHHASGLCGHWFDPPDSRRGHDGCHFIRVFSHYAGEDPATAWSHVHGAV